MATQTGVLEEEYFSHDGAENRLEYDEEEIPELPQTVEVLEAAGDVNHSEAGHGFRDRYQFDGIAIGEGDVYEMEITVTERADSGYSVRATYSEDNSQVFSGRVEESGDIVTELNGEVLERRY